jgi:hypothetical protein
MSIRFADSGYYLALLNEGDEWHARAEEQAGSLRGRFVTTEWVLVEVANACSHAANRPNFLRLVDLLRAKPNVTIVAMIADRDGVRSVCQCYAVRAVELSASIGFSFAAARAG